MGSKGDRERRERWENECLHSVWSVCLRLHQGMWKDSLIHWSLELLLGAGGGEVEEDGGCERTLTSSSSSSSSSSEYPLSAAREASDRSEEPLYSWIDSWRDHSWHSRDMSSWRRPTWCTQAQNIRDYTSKWGNLVRKFIFDTGNKLFTLHTHFNNWCACPWQVSKLIPLMRCALKPWKS